MVITWDPFTSSDNATIDGGTLSYTIPASGVDAGKVDVFLAPNSGATPAGTSYRVRYYLALFACAHPATSGDRDD